MPHAVRNAARLVLLVLIGLFAVSAASAQTRPPGENRMMAAVGAVVGVNAFAPETARSSRSLGVERQGSGVVIGADGLVLTVGYLILEARRVVVTSPTGDEVEAKIVAYDYDTGFGLVRATFTERVRAATLGSSAALKPGDAVYIASRVADVDVTPVRVVARREFAGYWEYLLPDAIFTAPQYIAFGGAALLATDGSLVGIGSLAVRNAGSEAEPLPGNMFIPIDDLKPLLGDLLALGKRSGKERPWLGVWTAEADDGGVAIGFVAPDSPAAKAGLRRGDVIVRVDGAGIAGAADLYKKVWGAAEKAAEISLSVRRQGTVLDVKVAAIGRSTFFAGVEDDRR